MAIVAGGIKDNQAVFYRSFGCPSQVLRLEQEELPPLERDYRVEMLIAPVNPSDLIPVRGAYAHRVRPPRVAGYEGVGRVVEVRNE
ncbi:alcohol dehydrogenase catalytic domain-containing protein, partial [Streptococcus pyogenes]|uniref:alcohol dehydrogenase catalytic domain-containing protein n=1 Tax=Streptococcus pyogenes TaxID=1314 RepID=UPI003DA0C90F